MSRFITSFITCTSVLLAPLATLGQENPADVIAPLVDDQTLVVVRIDLEKFDPAGWSRSFGALLAQVAPSQPLPAGIKGLKALREAGAAEFYVVVSLADFPEQPPLFAVPLEQGSIPAELAKRLGETADAFASVQLPGIPKRRPSPITVKRVGKLAVAASAPRIDRLLAQTPKERPELAAAFAATAGAPLQVVVVPSADQRRVLHELAPVLAKQLGDLPLATLTGGIVWASVGLDGPPNRWMKVIMQSENPPAAAEAVDALKAVFRRIAVHPQLGRILRKEALDALLPEAHGDQMVIELSDENGRLKQWEQAVLAPAFSAAREAANRDRAKNQMKQIALGMQAMAALDKVGKFPDAASRDKDGHLLLSWRVHMLPYLEQQSLYDQFRLDEPWDSNHNRKLIGKMPTIYAFPGSKVAAEGKTVFQVLVGPDTVFPDGRGMAFREILDGTTQTIMIVDVNDEHAVPWTKPEDWKYDPKVPKKGLGGNLSGGFLTIFADGSVRLISANVDKGTLRKLVTPRGKEPIEAAALQ